MFYANGAWEALPSMNINFVPYAVESTTVGGYGSGDLLRVDHLPSEVVAPFTFADYGKLVDLAAGKLNGSVLPTLSSGQVLGSDGSGNWTAVTPLTAAGLPACATGEYLRVSSGALVCQAVAMTGGTVTSITAGAGLTGGTIATSGTIGLATVGSGGSGTKLTYDSYGRVTAAASLAESDIPTLTAAGKVNGSAITGTIGNGTAISTSGAIQTSTDLMAGRFYLYDGGGTNTIGFRAPATVVPYVLIYPAAQGTAGQTLVNDGSGQLTWTTPLASVSGFAPLANGKIWIGDASGKAQEVTMSGDGSLASNGSLTLNTVPVAKGGTGLSASGTANQILGVNPGATGLEYKSVVAGTGVTITPTAGTLTISAAGSGGTVTSVDVSVPSYMTSSGGPITSNGSIALGFSAQNANTVFAGPLSGSAAPGFRVLNISDIKSSVAGGFLQATGACAAGQTLTYSSVSDVISCAGYTLTSSQVTTALGYTPVNQAGDAMTGALSLPANGLSVGTTDLVTTATGVGVGTATPATRLDVNGTLKIADGAEACSSAGNGGMIRYSGATLQYCNGSSWQTVGIAGAGLTSLNGQMGSTQSFAIGSAGLAPAFSSATNTHTLNLPMASSTGVTAGLLAKIDYDTFAAKQPAGSYVTTLSGDVTSSGFTGGTVTTTIANNAVTNAKINDVGVDKITSAVGKYFTYAPNGAVCANGQILKWNFASSRWECAADAGITTETDPTVAAFAKNAPASDFTTPSGVLTLATVPVSKGGTGLVAAPTNGQLLIGNGTGYALGTITAGSGVNVANSAGGITITATGSGGTVTNVTGTAPIAVATGTSTPVVSIAKATAAVDGYLAATDFVTFNSKLGTASTFAGDVSGTSSTMSVDKIKGTPLSISSITTGQYLKYNGTNWINAVIDAADIGTGTFAASRMPAFSGDATSVAGSTALTLNTVTPAKGGTGLTAIGTANQILGVNPGATGLEYKSLTAGSGVSITPSAGTLTITATGSGGTVTNVTSANGDIAVATGTSTPVLTLNSGTAASQILKLDATAKIPAVDGSQLTGLSTAQFSTGTLPIARGGTNSATALNNGRLMTSVGGAIVELGAMTDGQLVVGKSAAAPQVVTLAGDATISNTGALTLNTVPVAKGGTGLTAAATNGQLLIGNGTGYTLGTITAGSGVNVANSAGGITITATGSGGTVTNVTGTAPIVVATGTSTPAVSIAKSTAAVDGYLAATDFATFNAKLGTASTFAGDISGTSSSMSVDKLKATPLLITTLTTGQYLKYNGTNWINAVIDAADIGTGTLPAARMPAHTGDVTSSAGSTTLTLATVTPAKGGTGLTSIGTANQILGVNTGATGLEYKTLTAGTGVTITPAAGTLTINATGSGGTVTNVTSANADIAVATGSSTPLLTLNSGTGASQILKLNASSQIPAVDGSLLTNLNPASLSAVIPVTKGGTGVATLTSRGVLVGQGTAAVTSAAGAAGTVLQGNGASVDPSFTAIPVYGVNGTTTGTLGLSNGAASGATTTLAPSPATTTAYTFTLPSSGGTNGYVLQTNGSGATTWAAPSGSGTVNSGTANQLAYYSGTGTAVGGLTSANSSVLTTNGSGVPAWSTIATDIFTQYALLAGRGGGQSLRGGTAASENLTLDSTFNATKGSILIAPSGGNVGIGTTVPGTMLDVAGQSLLVRGTGTTAGEIRLSPGPTTGTNYVGFKAPLTNPVANILWQLPASDGTSGQLLSTNGAGVLSWATASGGGALSAGDGSAGAPGFYFTSQTNTGMFRPTTSALGFSTGGSERVRIDTNGTLLVGTSLGAGANAKQVLLGPVASVGAYGISNIGSGAFDGGSPGYFSGSGSGTAQAIAMTSAFTGDLVNYQVNSSSKYKVDYAGNTTQVGTLNVAGGLFTVDAAGNITAGGSFTPTGVVKHPDGSASAPGVSFTSQVNTGMFRPTTSALGFSTNGTERARFDANGTLLVGTSLGAGANAKQVLLGPVASVGAYGISNIGSGAFDGGSPGYFSGSGSGTAQAIAMTSAFTGDLVNYQVNSSSKYKVDYAGNTTQVGTLNVAGGLFTVDAAGNITAGGNFTPTGVVKHPDGSAGAPGVSFTSQTNTGMFRPTTSALGFSTGGSERVRIDTNGTLLVGTSLGAGANAKQVLLGPVASVGAYGISNIGSGAFDGASSGYFSGSGSGTAQAIAMTSTFTGDLVNYQVNSSSKYKVDYVGNTTQAGNLTASGTLNVAGGLFTVDAAGNITAGGTFTPTGVVKHPDGSAAAPGVSFTSQVNTGMFRPTTSALGFSTNGTERARFDANGTLLVGTNLAPGANAKQVLLGPVASSGAYGISNVGSGAFDGITPGYFSGSGSGTAQAIAMTSTFTGDLVNYQVNSATKYKVDYAGNTTQVGTLSAASGLFTVDAAGNITTGGTFTPTGVVKVPDGSAGTPGVSFTSQVNTGMFRPTTSAVAFSTGGSERLRIDANGTLLVGTSLAPGANAKQVLLGPVASSGAYGISNVGSGAFDGASSGYFSGSGSGTAQAIAMTSTFTGDLVNYQVNSSSKYKVDYVGNTTQAGNLTASGTLNVAGGLFTVDAAGNITAGGSFTPTGVVKHPDGSAGAPGVSFTSQVNTGMFRPTTSALAFSTNGTERARFDANGTLLVGTNLAPGANAKQVLLGPVASSGAYGISNIGSGAFDGASPGYFSGSGTGTAQAIAMTSTFTGDLVNYQVNSSSKYKVDYLGNSTQSGTLSVATGNFAVDASGNITAAGNFTPTGVIRSPDGTAAAPAHTFSSQTNTGMFRPTTSVLALSTNGSERVRIDSTGNVGIGTTTPGSGTALSVEGQIRTKSGSITTGAVDWSVGNAVTTTYDCASNMTMANLRDGGSYTLAVTGTGTAMCGFSTTTTGDDANTVTYRFSPANAARTASSHTIYSLMRIGTVVYVSWISGF